ncbi:hypothetical protein BDK51DRAFT_38729 [Blyttiomyces helicus]|uniref:Uncharacterized protein n=1 Tax=Blyttiomyces helicus TaxID=388810 RepID=A0A4P9W7X7_9FUNG|nr:hypothetical protein BDK51DRAFT_38729 [Blyttiomyces helicus]|eukprot:RKO87513.1 hypothetical protein BDK51DRAFT_38729 [Blyttiomyces helicus]
MDESLGAALDEIEAALSPNPPFADLPEHNNDPLADIFADPPSGDSFPSLQSGLGDAHGLFAPQDDGLGLGVGLGLGFGGMGLGMGMGAGLDLGRGAAPSLFDGSFLSSSYHAPLPTVLAGGMDGVPSLTLDSTPDLSIAVTSPLLPSATSSSPAHSPQFFSWRGSVDPNASDDDRSSIYEESDNELDALSPASAAPFTDQRRASWDISSSSDFLAVPTPGMRSRRASSSSIGSSFEQLTLTASDYPE